MEKYRVKISKNHLRVLYCGCKKLGFFRGIEKRKDFYTVYYRVDKTSCSISPLFYDEVSELLKEGKK